MQSEQGIESERATPVITDHTFRILAAAERTSGARGAASIAVGMCGYRGTCNQPREKHITVSDFRAAKAAETGLQYGHAGQHHGIGTPECPTELHHHCDERCEPEKENDA